MMTMKKKRAKGNKENKMKHCSNKNKHISERRIIIKKKFLIIIIIAIIIIIILYYYC